MWVVRQSELRVFLRAEPRRSHNEHSVPKTASNRKQLHAAREQLKQQLVAPTNCQN